MERNREYLMVPLDSEAYRWLNHALVVVRDMYYAKSKDTDLDQRCRDVAAKMHREIDFAYRELWKMPVYTFADAELADDPTVAYAGDARKDVW